MGRKEIISKARAVFAEVGIALIDLTETNIIECPNCHQRIKVEPREIDMKALKQMQLTRKVAAEKYSDYDVLTSPMCIECKCGKFIVVVDRLSEVRKAVK